MLRPYRTCNPTVGFSKYEFNNKCKEWTWIGPNIGLDFNPMSPNNEFVERG